MQNKRISKSLFLPLKGARTREEQVQGTASHGFFADAGRRFISMGISRIALGVIILIVLFSLFAPLFIARSESLMDPYYAKMGPRVAFFGGNMGIMRGSRMRRLGERGAVRLAAIGIGAMDKTGEGTFTPENASDGEYTPLISVSRSEGERTYEVRVDSYLEVGFIYKTVEAEEYERMVVWERETGLPLLYPLIANNEYSADPTDANIWYKTGDGGVAVSTDGGAVTEIGYSSDMRLEDNYLRDESGNAVYRIYSGGGDYDTAGYKVRLLYYNYYRYRTGSEPYYLFGTDSQGYDLALRLASGIRLSLLIALAVSAINFVIGAAVGSVEGYYGGAVDLVLERVTDVLSGVPFIVVATLFQIYLAGKVGAIPSLLFAFVLTGWLGTANRVRGQFYRFKGREYVMAARTLGASDARIILRHIFPNTLGTLITASALVIPGVIFSESMLSFLGIMNLGGEGVTSLGTLLSEAAGIWTNYPHLILFPALVISLLMISFNLLGNGLRDAFDPTERGV